jgi:hypothetical protein
MTLRVQGIAAVERAAVGLGMQPAEAKTHLDDLVARELASERTGRLPGFSLAPGGVDALDKLLAEEGLRASQDLRDAYERFLVVDPLVKRACSKAQIDGFDTGLDDLTKVNDKARVVLRKIVAAAPRYANYRSRLESCMTRLLEGDATAFTKPLAESYHQVWWELHQDLLLTLGLEREE